MCRATPTDGPITFEKSSLTLHRTRCTPSIPPRRLRSCPGSVLFEPHSWTPGEPVAPDLCVWVAVGLGTRLLLLNTMWGPKLGYIRTLSLVTDYVYSMPWSVSKYFWCFNVAFEHGAKELCRKGYMMPLKVPINSSSRERDQ